MITIVSIFLGVISPILLTVNIINILLKDYKYNKYLNSNKNYELLEENEEEI